MATDQKTSNPFRFEKWECPICGQSDTLVVHGKKHSGVDSLKVHLHETAGRGHGEKYEYPDGYTKHDKLEKYVEQAEAGSGRTRS